MRSNDLPALIAARGAAAVAGWEQFVSNPRLAPSSRAIYCGIARRFLNWLEARGIELTRVAPDLVQEFLDAGEIDAATKSQYRHILSRFFDALVTHGAVPDNPAELLRELWKGRTVSAPAAGASEALADQFARFTPAERQATVDAAAVALAMHAIHLFTGGTGGQPADLERCEEAIRLGEQVGITPLSWVGPSEAAPAAAGAAINDPKCESSSPDDDH